MQRSQIFKARQFEQGNIYEKSIRVVDQPNKQIIVNIIIAAINRITKIKENSVSTQNISKSIDKNIKQDVKISRTAHSNKSNNSKHNKYKSRANSNKTK